MRAITRIALTTAVCGLFLSQGTFAQQELTPYNPVPKPVELPVYSGGVGDDDMDYIKSVEHQYNLKLVFTEASGTFLADLPVDINDKSGKTVVNTTTKGPILLVNLPAGIYTVKVADGDVKQQQKLTVSDRSQRIYQFRFPTHPGEITEKDERE
jgi:hypothetical protein